MNNDVLFEVVKYVDAPPSKERIQQVRDSPESLRRNFIANRDIIGKKLLNRPTLEELKDRNIIKRNQLSFSHIHDMLNKINFESSKKPHISPWIASRVCNLDFKLRKKMIISKLGLQKVDKYFKYSD